jgi:hypothetical protein
MLFSPHTPPPPIVKIPSAYEEQVVDINFWRRYASPGALAVPFTARLANQPEIIHRFGGEIIADDPEARDWDGPDDFETMLTPELRAAAVLR